MSHYLGAVGIAVSDLEKSARFYCDQIGMVQLQTIELPYMKEIVLGFEGIRSASVVLMHYIDGSNPNCTDNPIKLVFYVDNAKAILNAIRNANYPVTREAEVYPNMGGIIIGFGKDPDGYTVELIEKPAKVKNNTHLFKI